MVEVKENGVEILLCPRRAKKETKPQKVASNGQATQQPYDIISLLKSIVPFVDFWCLQSLTGPWCFCFSLLPRLDCLFSHRYLKFDPPSFLLFPFLGPVEHNLCLFARHLNPNQSKSKSGSSSSSLNVSNVTFELRPRERLWVCFCGRAVSRLKRW